MALGACHDELCILKMCSNISLLWSHIIMTPKLTDKILRKDDDAVSHFNNFKRDSNTPIVYSGCIQWSPCSAKQSSGMSRDLQLSQQMGAGLVCREHTEGLQASPLERSTFTERPLHPGSKLQQQSITSLRAFSPSVMQRPVMAAIVTLPFIQCHLNSVVWCLFLCLGRHLLGLS